MMKNKTVEAVISDKSKNGKKTKAAEVKTVKSKNGKSKVAKVKQQK